MDIEKELEKIVAYRNSALPISLRKSESAINSIASKIISDYRNGDYDFSKFVGITIKKPDNVRHVKVYRPLTCEDTLCIYIKRLLDKRFHIEYPNRNDFVHSLFDVLSAIKDMNGYTVFRFDFMDYFNSVSADYVLKKFMYKQLNERNDIDLLEVFTRQTKRTYAGLNTSNIICEIIAREFDDTLTLKFKDYGLIFYRRYIDDGIMVFNQVVERAICDKLIEEAIHEVYHDDSIITTNKCKTWLNSAKTKYMNAYDLAKNMISGEFDYLGYSFVLKPTYRGQSNRKMITEITFGITKKKIDKYTRRIDNLIDLYMEDGDLELLRHRLKAFTHRTVYQVQRFGSKALVWKVKGFIANYQELRYRMGNLTNDTEAFLKNAIVDSFAKKSLPLPYFLKTDSNESVYSLYNNLSRFKTLLFVENIGFNKAGVDKLCKQLNIWAPSKDYDDLVRDYLIKVKVGH